MAVTEINATQYTNLQTTYSEKNNIDNVKGVEYKVNGTDVIEFQFEDNNSIVDSNGKIEIGYVTHNDGDTTPTYSFESINGHSIPNNAINIGNIQGKAFDGDSQGNWFIRKENYVINGTFRAYTTEVIQNIDDISVSCEITYNTYHYETHNPSEQILNISNNSSWTKDKPVYEIIRTPNNQQNTYEDAEGNIETQIQTTDTALPGSIATIRTRIVGMFEDWYASAGTINSIYKLSKPKIISNDENGVTVEIDYTISIWDAHNEILITQWGVGNAHFFNYYINNATSIQFKVQANGISTTENQFKYGDGQYKEYELESNDLMQYEENQSYEDRQSYKTAQKMLDATQINRMIVSFDLLDLRKIVAETVRPADTNNEAVIINRYLNTGDLIKIKDQNDEYIGQYYDDSGNLVIPDFEIISYHGHWDGTFHVEVVCKQKL